MISNPSNRTLRTKLVTIFYQGQFIKCNTVLVFGQTASVKADFLGTLGKGNQIISTFTFENIRCVERLDQPNFQMDNFYRKFTEEITTKFEINSGARKL